MSFKMKGFNPGKGTGMGSSFKKNEIVFNTPRPKRKTQIIDDQMYYDAVTDRRDPGDFSNTTAMDIDPRFKDGDYDLPGEGVHLNTSAPVGYGSVVKYSDEHERYMGVKDAGAGYGPEEIGLKNKQERINDERARNASKLIREYDGVLPITPASTEYNKENFDRWRSDPKNKPQSNERKSEYLRRFRNDLADLANIVNEVTVSSEAGYDLSKMGDLNPYEAGQFEVNRTKEDIRKKNEALSRDRSINIKVDRYKNKINKRLKDGTHFSNSYEARKLIEMGHGDFVEAANVSQMTPRQRRKYNKKIAKEEKKKEKINKKRNISEDYTPQSSEEYTDKYTRDMDDIIKEEEGSKKIQESLIKKGGKMLRNRNYFKIIDDGDDDDDNLITENKEQNNNDGEYIPQTQRT